MKTTSTEVTAWFIPHAASLKCGFDSIHIPSIESGLSRDPIPLMGAVLFSDYNVLVLYGKDNNIAYYDRLKFTDAETRKQLRVFMKIRPIGQTETLAFMAMMNPSGTVRVITDDPASTELHKVLTDMQLAVAFERMQPKPKVRALLRQQCRERLKKAVSVETKQILEIILRNPLPDLAFNDTLIAMKEAMEGDTEIVIK